MGFIKTVSIFVQPNIAFVPIEFTLRGMLIAVNPVQFLNALASIKVMDCGRLIVDKPLQPENAEYPIDVILSEKKIFDKLLQLTKV